MSSLEGSSFWCYRCNRIVRVPILATDQDPLLCPDCSSGFLEEIRNPTLSLDHNASPPLRRRTWRSSSGNGDRSPFNPVIVLRGGNNDVVSSERRNFELYYNDVVSGSGLQPLPPSVTEFLMGSGFDHLLDQLAHLEGTAVRVSDRAPTSLPPPVAASKAAIESMPVVKIIASHISNESQCAVCMEPFKLDCDAREMPCGHIYHSDCIVPWLSVRNSCPICRHELPAEPVPGEGAGDGAVGLTIWRLPGGGFAVGRFIGGGELPVVYTEMDGGINDDRVGVGGGGLRRNSWDSSVGRSREGRSRQGGGLGGAMRNVVSYFRRFRSSLSRSSGSSGSSSSGSGMSGRSRSSTVFSRFSRRGD